MGERRKGREAALRMLYQAEVSRDPLEQVMATYLDSGLSDIPLSALSRTFAIRLVKGVDLRRNEIDELIRAGSSHWRLERMAAVDRNVLRVALFELLDDPDTPAAVILDEAIDIAKDYGGEESGAFVNGVADGIRRRLADGSMTREGWDQPTGESSRE